ncbi:MAG: formylglycine-generating enzyme family protein [Cyanobacteria bacterium P01_F01_bin.86]
MTDPTQRFRLFQLLADLPPAQFEGLLFALNPPAGNVSASSAPQSHRVGELLRWAESPIGCQLQTVATLAGHMFNLEVPDFSRPEASTSVGPEPDPTPAEPQQPSEWKVDLGNGVFLEMVSIPGGRFWMGSPASEEGRAENEGPVHSVTVLAFAMGKYPVTQAQWSEVAALPQVKVALNPFPSYFQGAQRPVERVNWYEAMEFCERLSRLTRHIYHLPSEAEWEYACRARTNTPFHFGATITPDQANYDGNYTYGPGVKGIYREHTTEVGSFLGNAFGLHDMHGNVREWCQDVWHDSYQGAPTNGSVWVEGGHQDLRVVRGGSWFVYPRFCRSAYRYSNTPGNRHDYIGFRVVCSAPRTL